MIKLHFVYKIVYFSQIQNRVFRLLIKSLHLNNKFTLELLLRKSKLKIVIFGKF
jgi:hypothetical protein